MKKTTVESVCIFGSTARDSADGLSDRDVLVIASDKSRRDDIVKYWRQLGWSVAEYTPSRILKMIQYGSLFIQHLRLEGMILEDKQGWLRVQLNQARMKKSYALDAQKSVSLALPIERLDHNKLINEEPIAADLAYISIRNYGICYLADRDRLTFDYSEIVKELAKDFDLSKNETSLLQSMRIGKICYRKGVQCSEIVGTIGELSVLLSKFFYDNPLGKIELGSPIRNLPTGYSTLRDFESWMVSTTKNAIPINEEYKDINTLKKWICSPRSYSWNIRNFSSGELNEIKQSLEHKNSISETWSANQNNPNVIIMT